MNESIAEPKAKVVVLTPRADFYQDGDSYTVEVELPGVKKNGVNLSLENGRLTVTARREEREDGNAIYRESLGGEYRRVFELAPSVDKSKVSANLEQGLLTIRLQKAEAEKSRQIAVE